MIADTCRKPGNLDFDDVAMALGILVVPDSLTGAAARLVRNKTEGRIRLNSRIRGVGARRFAIAHELGHWFLHEDQSQLFLCTAANMRDYKKSPMEAEANHFASEFLIPAVLFRPMIQRIDPSLHRISEWAEQFKASLTAMAIRFVRETQFDCILVSIRDGRVEWSWKEG